MKVLVCGGRDYANKDRVFSILNSLSGQAMGDEPNPSWLPRPDLFIISGGAKGADTLAIDWAVVHWVPFQEYPADWSTHGKAAGFIRNKQMLEEGKPDLVVAFPGGKGTKMMIDIARKAGVAVEEIIDESNTD